MSPRTSLLSIGCLFALATAAPAAIGETLDRDVGAAIASLQEAGKEGRGFEQASEAAERLRELSANQLPVLLDGLADTNPVAENWFRGVVFDVARQQPGPEVKLLSDYAMDQSNNPVGRGLAMELIRKQAPQTAERLVSECLNDPSLPLREMAVEQAIEQAAELQAENQTTPAITRYRQALDAARHPRQLSRIVEALRELDQEATVRDAFRLITDWQAVAPFDNRGGDGYGEVYPPESQFVMSGSVDLSATYDGKNGPVSWRPVRGSEDGGVVDLAAAFDKEKGAVAYVYTEFDASEKRPAQVRLGCINANKVWVNGREVMANEVYHAGSMLDQYIADCELRQGSNKILLKICQNEQTEPWAQEWEFTFRVTDRTGKGLTSGE